MPTMTIDEDVRAALDAGRITWAEAGEIRDARKTADRCKRKIDSFKASAKPFVDDRKTALESIERITKKMLAEPDA